MVDKSWQKYYVAIGIRDAYKLEFLKPSFEDYKSELYPSWENNINPRIRASIEKFPSPRWAKAELGFFRLGIRVYFNRKYIIVNRKWRSTSWMYLPDILSQLILTLYNTYDNNLFCENVVDQKAK